MRSSASPNKERGQPKFIRTKPSPPAPKLAPSWSATRAFCKMWLGLTPLQYKYGEYGSQVPFDLNWTENTHLIIKVGAGLFG